MKKREQVPIDKWQKMDVFFAGTSLALVLVLASLPIEMFENSTTKHWISYGVVGVSLIQYCRLLLYFLVVNSISKMLLTLVYMILDTIAFILLLCLWLFIMSIIFTTLFQGTEGLLYEDVWSSFKILWNAMLGTYLNQGINIELYWIHVAFTHFYVYMSNILLLNYLIAIMSTTYESLLESGSFMFKVNLYNYCERYLIAFRNDAYGELAIHTAPINILTVLVQIAALLLPEKFMRMFCKYFSFGMYWLENIIFIICFIVFELLLVLPVYIKNIPLVGWASMGLFTKAFNAAIWVFAGIPITLYIVASDVYNYVNILRML